MDWVPKTHTLALRSQSRVLHLIACIFRFFRLKFCIFAQKSCSFGKENPEFNVKHILFTAELFIYIKKEVNTRMFLGIQKVL
jgi:hypothetical protein